jgi:murein L,D-transpeptidase YafK
MRIGLRRISTCLRVCALVTAGIGVAHGSAIGASATERAEQAAEPTGSIALPEGKAAAEATSIIGEHQTTKTVTQMLLPPDRVARLTQKGLAAGNPVMIRIFKAEHELELWMQKDDRFELFATYAICKWSGRLGPKLREGDRQAPEGVYVVGMPQIHRKGRWPRSLNVGYPNAFDRAMDRTGSYILVHGGCSSTGCFAMTNSQMEEIYRLSEEALKQGQTHIPIHVFPFRMTEANLRANSDNRWQSFWHNLKDAYDMFERTRVPPQVSVCGKRYVVREGTLPGAIQAADEGTDPFDTADCLDTATEVTRVASVDDDDDDDVRPAKITKARKVVSKTQRRRSAGRNTRKAYAAARKARMAARSAKIRSAARADR